MKPVETTTRESPSTRVIFIYHKVADSRQHASVVEVNFGDGAELMVVRRWSTKNVGI